MKIVAIIQARMGSTRLPGKVMKEILGKPLLEYQIERVRRSTLIDQIVIATTNTEEEQPIIDLCNRLSVSYYRGSEQDVLLRYWEAATRYKATVVVRLTSDCPLIDPEVIDGTIATFLSNIKSFDYVSNTIERTFPRGFDVEVVSRKVLETANREATKISHREHVTPYIYLHPQRFNLASVKHPIDVSHYRLTVDTVEDLQLIERIYHHFSYPKITTVSLNDIVHLLQENPEWCMINSNIPQKKLGDYE